MKKILMITMQYPYPKRCGFTVRLADMCDYLCQHFEIDLLVNSEEMQGELIKKNLFNDVHFCNSNNNLRTIGARIKQRIKPAYFDDSCYIGNTFIKKVLELYKANEYDICMIHTPLFAYCLDALPDSVYKVVDLHDIWFQKYSEFEKIGKGKLLSQFRDKERELKFYKRVNMAIAISLWDLKYLQENGISNCVYVPVSFHPKPLNKNNKCDNQILYPAGKGEHNIDAIEFFIQKILPIVKHKIKNVQFLIPNADELLKKKYGKNSNIVFLPFADDIAEIYAKADITVVPLRIKSGLKIKVLESFSFGIPTILSEAAAQGVYIETYTQENYSLEAEVFAQEVIRSLKDNEYKKRLSESGLEIIKRYYSPNSVYSNLVNRLLNNGDLL